ncbi:dihydroneopterin aldolase [Algiphilus aromaticivorans]|uniref:dihydroneopterin aldolase n=1 Tax=Algiphilus aromaticivorans TaxID=382454 RepID=UPI0005C22960|nr:dihydroneopterin aldolase [Algiphilus aromaticivorans]
MAELPADRILLRGIAARAVVGVYAFEREASRPLSFDLELACDLAPAGASDDVADTLDYDAAAAVVHAVCAELAPQLIETLAETVAARLLGLPRVAAATVTVHKPGAVTGVEDIAVRITRRHDSAPSV